jgi:NAD-dependent dihydropyrimidine dehydrogenase PreA subunit
LKRQIIRIDEEKCTGCGLCIPNCPEGALQIIDGKARLVSDLSCDGLGACIGECPEGAIEIEVREAAPYDEASVMETLVTQGPGVVKAHIEHLKSHGQVEYLREAIAYLGNHGVAVPEVLSEPSCRCAEAGAETRSDACPGARVMNFEPMETCGDPADGATPPSALRHWPVQIMLVPPHAPFLKGADLLIAADCVAFAYADFHRRLLRGRALLVGCPKLDDAALYEEKLARIFKENDIRSVTVAHMEVPCCFGMVKLVQSALERAGKKISLETRMISVKGEEM